MIQVKVKPGDKAVLRVLISPLGQEHLLSEQGADEFIPQSTRSITSSGLASNVLVRCFTMNA